MTGYSERAGRTDGPNEYDYIFAGGGAAGLSLAYFLLREAARAPRILIIDHDRKEQNDRTWCFWTAQPTPFEHLVHHSWDQVAFISDDFRRIYTLAPYRYQMIRGIDFYRGLKTALEAAPSVEFLTAKVERVTSTATQARVTAGGKTYTARWAFDSTFTPRDYFSGPPGYHYLKQHFKGWEIETSQDCFDPSVATMFDFRTPQQGAMRFVYVLPDSPRRALVEYTLFSHDLLKPREYDQGLKDYIEGVLGINDYQVTSVETGIIPMTDLPMPRKISPRVLAIGTKGGRVKPSSGYGFLRIIQDTQAIAKSLATTGSPFNLPASPIRYRWLDTIMLQVMYRSGSRMKAIFTAMFRNNPIQQLFAFLDEEASLLSNLRLMVSLPPLPFLIALIRVKLLRRI